ncbi:MAG: hypothetical protein L3J16_06060 [Anaerolineales bacterium]|nr:hypothetical protein [Anaerolineales bacterium]
MRKFLLVVCVVLLSYIVGVVLLQYYNYKTTPQWERDLGAPNPLEIVESSSMSVQYQQDRNYIRTEILYAPEWSTTEVSELLRFINIPHIDDDQVAGNKEKFDMQLLELWIKRNSALSVIAERFRVGAPIDEEFRQQLIDELIAGLYQTTSPRFFGSTVANVMRSGLVDTPGPIRDRILLIYAHPKEFFGPHGEMAAENIKRQLKSRGVFVLKGETHGG